MAGVTTYYQTGNHAGRPANAAGCVLYSCTTHGLIYRDDGTTWTTFLTLATGNIAQSIIDAKGDLIAGTAADTAARLAAAANGASLITASGETTGLKWRLNNDAGTVAPTINEDSGDGYQVGSRWIDTTGDKEYVCLDASVGAAVWTETTTTGGGGGGITRSTLGTTSIGGSFESNTPSAIYMKKITLASDGFLASISFHIKGNASGTIVGISAALRADAAGTPGDYIGWDSIAPYDAGGSGVYNYGIYLSSTGRWFTVPIGKWLAAADYWICAVFSPTQTNGTQIAYAGSGGDRVQQPPSAVGAVKDSDVGTAGSNNYSIFADILR